MACCFGLDHLVTTTRLKLTLSTLTPRLTRFFCISSEFLTDLASCLTRNWDILLLNTFLSLLLEFIRQCFMYFCSFEQSLLMIFTSRSRSKIKGTDRFFVWLETDSFYFGYLSSLSLRFSTCLFAYLRLISVKNHNHAAIRVERGS